MNRISLRLTLTLLMVCVLLAGSGYAQKKPHFEKPILVTSAGQSADVTMAGALLKRAKIEAAIANLAKEEDLKGIHTLIIVAGFSSKGLGAAGISRDQEMERVTALIAAARKSKIKILTMHLGGTARRGPQSDDFNKVAAEAAEYMIVVKQGDEDSFFSSIAKEKNIPLDLVEKIANALDPLRGAFE